MTGTITEDVVCASSWVVPVCANDAEITERCEVNEEISVGLLVVAAGAVAPIKELNIDGGEELETTVPMPGRGESIALTYDTIDGL